MPSFPVRRARTNAKAPAGAIPRTKWNNLARFRGRPQATWRPAGWIFSGESLPQARRGAPQDSGRAVV